MRNQRKSSRRSQADRGTTSDRSSASIWRHEKIYSADADRPPASAPFSGETAWLKEEPPPSSWKEDFANKDGKRSQIKQSQRLDGLDIGNHVAEEVAARFSAFQAGFPRGAIFRSVQYDPY